MYEKYLDILIKVPLFTGFSSEEILSLLKCTNPIINDFNKKDYVIIEGEKSDSIGIMLDGDASICRENAAGNRIIISVVNSGGIFGEMTAFSNQSMWPATVIANKKCKILFLKTDKILNQCKNTCLWHRNLIQNFLMIISQKALMLSQKVEYLTIKSMRVKISKYLFEQYKKTGNTTFRLSMNRNILADFFNVARPSLSREIARMRDEGIIEFHKESFKILNLEIIRKSLLES